MGTMSTEHEGTRGYPEVTTIACHGAETTEHWEWIEQMGRLPGRPGN